MLSFELNTEYSIPSYFSDRGSENTKFIFPTLIFFFLKVSYYTKYLFLYLSHVRKSYKVNLLQNSR
jgi:hypothetical protein